MLEFDVNGVTYQAQPMPARRQLHVIRRMGPAVIPAIQEIFNLFGSVPATLEALAGAMSDEKNDELVKQFINIAPSFADAMSAMSDADVDYIIDSCLHLVSRKMMGGTGWTKIMASNGVLMFQDMTLKEMTTIAFKVLQGNLGDFFSAGP